ncbi:MAG: FAD-dependent oxidoreductase [Nocardioidaceae bacterium]|nr:FAD-dependent oxidoreductase [Nocardioidaceae bacterium]
MTERADAAIVGGGHNALVAATYLARAGLEVVVLERLEHVGGAAVSARPFDGVDARLSRYSYLVSLMPQELIDDLALDIELRSRSTSSYTPYGDNGLLIETEPGPATRASFRELTGSDDEFEAWQRFYAEISTLTQAIAPTLLRPLPHIGNIRDQVDMAIWTDLVDEPLGTAITRRFTHDIVRGVVSTDALVGTFASLFDPTLVQNRCFLFHLMGHGTGEWRVPVGGMGALTGALEQRARAAGADIRTNHRVTSIDATASGVAVHGADFTLEADWLLSGVAPYTLAQLLGDKLPPKPKGSQLKVNVLVDRLPRLRSGIDPTVAFAGTFHIDESSDDLERAYASAVAGHAVAAGEIYCHTLTDRSILGSELAASTAQTLTYFGFHAHADGLDKQAAWRDVMAALDRYLAEPLASVISKDRHGEPCVEIKSAAEVESDLGMPGGNIFHGSLAWPWLEEGAPAHTPAQRWGVSTAHERVLMCGSGATRGGNVSGIAGHNAAHALLEFLAT